MQLIDICTNAIALFGAVYFLSALTAHLHYHWQHPETLELAKFDRRLEVVKSVETIELPPSVQQREIAESISAIEVALAEVAAEIEAVEATSVTVEEAIDLSRLTIRELKSVARDRQLKRYCNFTKAELIAALC